MNNASADFSFIIRKQLKQITPYLHFQHDIQTNPGAVLRATEVKPKLDRFIRQKMGGNDFVPLNWFLNKDKSEALNYKLQFRPTGNAAEISKAGEYAIEAYTAECNNNQPAKRNAENKMRAEINGMYFANMVDKKKKVGTRTVNKTVSEYSEEVRALFKETVFYPDPIEMTIICMIPELRQKIVEVLDEFFLLHNFGSRQTKGFGGFLPVSFPVNTGIQKYLDMNKLFFYADAGTTDIDVLMNHARTLYALFKGGLNLTSDDHPDRYIKAYIQREYLDMKYPDGDTGSDKAFAKRYILDYHLTDPDNTNEYKNYVFIRALLGLADQYNYLKADYGVALKKVVYVYHADSDSVIERFPSPITIKILGSRIFFLFDVEAVQPILNRLFYFTDENVTERIKKKTPAERKAFFEQNYPDNWIETPRTFTADDVRAMMSGFVTFFNRGSNGYPSAKSKLNAFAPPFQNTKNLTLYMGGVTTNV